MNITEAKRLWRQNFPTMYTHRQAYKVRGANEMQRLLWIEADAHLEGFVAALKLTGQMEVKK